MFSLESPHRDDFNEYIQYTIFNIKKENHSKLYQICSYRIFPRDSRTSLKRDLTLAHIRFWPGLGLPRPKAIVVIPQNQPLPKHLRKKTSKSAKHACHYATKERPVKITMYLGLDIIIKIKFTTIFDRCAILNVLNYLTKNFES